MSWSKRNKAASGRRATHVARLAGVAFVALLATAFAATAETFYKWTDAQGNIHYSDKAPKGVEATRIEVDAAAATAPPRVAPAREVAPLEAPAAAPAPDLLQQRRATRARLEANLAQARERLDLARKALAEVSGTQEGEQQYAQRQIDPASVNMGASGGAQVAPPTQTANTDPTQTRPTGGGMLGMAPRSNCRTTTNAAGKTVLICPTLVPGSAYYERVQKLEDDVRRAEEDVADAERAYRRGVD